VRQKFESRKLAAESPFQSETTESVFSLNIKVAVLVRTVSD